MSSNDPNPPDSLSDRTGFKTVDTISVEETPLCEVLSCVIEHEEAGIPLVIVGLNVDPNWSPFLQSHLSEAEVDGDIEQQQPDPNVIDERQGSQLPVSVFAWASGLSLVPKYLLPSESGETLSMAVEDLQNEVDPDRTGRALRQNHCASTFHRLTLSCAEGASDVWYIVAASHSQEMGKRLSTLSTGSQPTFMTASELLLSSFPVYAHVQSPGELLILPPQCYAQNLREGASSSVSWSRLSLLGLELALHRELPVYRRTCIPEEFGVRKIIYAMLKSYTSVVARSVSQLSESSSSNLNHDVCPSRMAEGLRRLIQLFDEVLLEEYSDDHDSLLLLDDTTCNPACDFCGSLLFLSYFRCTGVCLDLDRDSFDYPSMRLCGACYVEGRLCTCGEMAPNRLGSFSDMLQERNLAASLLSKCSSPHSTVVDDPGELSERSFSWPQIAVFQAAKELWKLRNIPDNDRRGRTCTPRGNERSHHVPSTLLINCKKCHAAKCFPHILQGNVHSSEALLANAADSDSTVWHQLHQTARQREIPQSGYQLQSLNSGERLVFFALNFSSRSPVKDEAYIGFYDIEPPQDPAPAGSEAGRGVSGDGHSSSVARSSTLGSRTSSRSTVIPQSDSEASDYPSRRTRRARHHSREVEGTDSDASRSRSKRNRSPESVDDTEPRAKRTRLRSSSPKKAKRIRLRRDSNKRFRAGGSRPSTTEGIITSVGVPPQPQGASNANVAEPTTTSSGSLPSGGGRDHTIGQYTRPAAGTSKPNKPAPLQKKITRTTSTNSDNLECASSEVRGVGDMPLTVPERVDQPLAFNFFNPTTDLRRGEPPSHSSMNFDRSKRLQGNGRTILPPLNAGFMIRGSTLPPPASTFSLTPLSSHSRKYSGDIGLHADGRSPPLRAHEHGRSSSQSRPLVAEAITRELIGRKNSREDIEATRVLETIQGDSLLMENMQAYIDLLRESGALEKPT